MKTAISIPDKLYQSVELLSKEFKCSKSSLFSQAMTEFLQKKENERILLALNKVYSKDSLDQKTGEEVLPHIKKKYARTLVDKW